MPRQTLLPTLVRQLKACLGDSLTVGTQSDSLYKQLLSDKQQWLVGEFDFPFLKCRWNKNVVAGDRYLTFPTTDITGATVSLKLERPLKAYTFWTAVWMELEYGIDEIDEMNSLNPDTNLPNRAQQPLDPIKRWQWSGADSTKFEIWPIPVTAQIVRFVGQRELAALSADTDKAELDDQLIVLSLAVDLLSKRKSADAQARLSEAAMRLRVLRASYATRSREVVLGGGRMQDSRQQRRAIPIVTIH